MKKSFFFLSAIVLLVFAACDDGGKKTDKCKNVTCGENAACDPETGICGCDEGYVGNPTLGCTIEDLCEDVTCGENAACDPATGECACDDGYVGDPVEGCTAGPCMGVTCGENASCDDETGQCECDPGYTGNPDDACVPIGACEENTCNGNGTCDDSSGLAICTCDTGYDGSTCDRCATGYEADPDNPGKCIHNPCIPDPCYGNGTCTLDEDRLPVCECDPGYTGGNCNYCDTANGYMEDPDNAGVCILSPCEEYDCGHGTCTLSEGNPVCVCDTGYTGELCDSCDDGYVESTLNPDTCIADPCAGQTCSGNGICSVNASDEAVCACETGYTGAICADCDSDNHYIASTLNPGTCIEDPCLSIPCGGNGECSVVDDVFSCTCATGWTGETCNACADGYTGGDCNICDDGYIASTVAPGTCIADPCAGYDCGNGTCHVSVEDLPVCACSPGYTGVNCSECADGFIDSSVTPGTCIADPCAGYDCGDGSCHVSVEDLPVCACPTGYTGVDCSECADGFIASTVTPGTCIADPCASDPCGAHGTCSVVDDAFLCTCEMGYEGETCSECMDGYIASTVTPGTCIVDPCIGHDCGDGSCHVSEEDLPVCACPTGYTGVDCSECADGYIASTVTPGTCIADPCASDPCGAHGTCSVVDDAFLCTCEMGYEGETCSECMDGYIASTVTPGTCIVDPCIAETCSGNGTCVVTNDTAECNCNTGYAGDACDSCAEGYEFYPAESSVCVDETIVQPGQFIINEILILAATDPVENGQWFEVYNTTDKPKRWADLSIIADFASISIPSDSELIVPPNGFMVVGSNPDTWTNGGVTINQLISGMVLTTVDGVIELERTSDSVLIDMVHWDDTWNHQNHRTLNLSPAALDGLAHELNDNPFHWCFGSFAYGDFFGTPGAANDDCRLSWCGIQWPDATSTAQGVPTELIYGRVYDELLTVGQDFSPFITAQVGYGPLESNPELDDWYWFDAAYNPEFTGDNNEEFMASIIPAEAGVFDYLYRVSTDGGLSYQYCGWFEDGRRGELTVEIFKSLYFSEYIEGSSNNKSLEIYNPFEVPVSLDGCEIRTYFNGSTSYTALSLVGLILDSSNTLVACHSSADPVILAVCQIPVNGGAMGFNGDDAVALVCDDHFLDVIGQIGFRPSGGWGTAPVRTIDTTLRRKCGITSGDPDGTDEFEPADEWDGYPTDTFDDLGVHDPVCP